MISINTYTLCFPVQWFPNNWFTYDHYRNIYWFYNYHNALDLIFVSDGPCKQFMDIQNLDKLPYELKENDYNEKRN